MLAHGHHIGREFTIATNQVDFAVPAKFGLTYRDKDNLNRTPLCIHRAPLGTHDGGVIHERRERARRAHDQHQQPAGTAAGKAPGGAVHPPNVTKI